MNTPPSPTAVPVEPPVSPGFTFEAQADDGARLSGSIDAPDADSATMRLQLMRLRVIALGPRKAEAPAPGGPAGKSGRPLGGGDFAAFNQQLAQLTKAGLPVEHGLRLIASDMRRGRLARTIEQVAAELERGTPLGEAFDKHRGRFPTLYGRLVDAGVRSGNLPGVLLGMGRHLELVQRLRGTLWRAVSYPLMVFAGLCIVLIFLGLFVLPQFREIYAGLAETRRQMNFRALSWRPAGPAPDPSLPWVTRWLMVLADAAPYLLGGLVALCVGLPLMWAVLRLKGADRAAADRLLLPMPLVGPVLRLNLIARWCDALRLGVSAGMDLPAAFALAGDVTGSPALNRDGSALVARLEAGKPLSSDGLVTRLIPATVPVAIDLASGHHDLPATLATLRDMYERQAESRLASLPTIITPLLVILVAGVTGFIIAGLLLPLIRSVENFM